MKIFKPDFLEVLATTKTPDRLAMPPIRKVNELFNQQIIADDFEREVLIHELNDVSMSVAARATYYGLKQNASLRRTGRKPEGWIVWAEQLDDPQTSYSYGQIHGTILGSDGILRNIDPVVVNQRDVPSGLNNPLERLDVLAKIIRRTNGLNDINLGEKDLSFDLHRQHLAEFMVGHGLQHPKQHIADTLA